MGLLNMCVGEKRKLIVPSRFGYGKEGRPPAIPPTATLVFYVELMNIVDIIDIKTHGEGGAGGDVKKDTAAEGVKKAEL